MAMVGQARQFDELAMLGCDMNSDVAFFFSKVPERMKKPPPNADDIFAAIAEEVEDTHQAGSVEEMMKLMTDVQMQKVLTQAGGKATWITFLEMIIGQKFSGSMQTGPMVARCAAVCLDALVVDMIGICCSDRSSAPFSHP
jgi:hypothetical protein|tara:strand:+ start:501 stop:923 length:423 start_codon:yes stop_codon:yes gene_type:complete